MNFQLASDVTEELNELHAKGINVNELLREMLNRRKEEIAQKKETISADMPTATSRYIPVRVQKVVHEEHGRKCSIPTCSKPAQHLHHTQTFALSRQHDPYYLAPLCKEHHLIAHSINLMVQKKRTPLRSVRAF